MFDFRVQKRGGTGRYGDTHAYHPIMSRPSIDRSPSLPGFSLNVGCLIRVPHHWMHPIRNSKWNQIRNSKWNQVTKKRWNLNLCFLKSLYHFHVPNLSHCFNFHKGCSILFLKFSDFWVLICSHDFSRYLLWLKNLFLPHNSPMMYC